MSMCDVCLREVDDGVACGECAYTGIDEDELVKRIADWLDNNIGALRDAESYKQARFLVQRLREGHWK